MKQRRYLLDTTLRDGEQAPGLCFSPKQKIKIASLLDAYGIHQIEAGIPAVSRQDKETIAEIIANKKNAIVSVWSRILTADIEEAIEVKPDIIHFSVPVSRTHIYEKLRKDKEWVLNKLCDCLDLIEESGIKATVGFEDAFRADKDFMLAAARIVLDRGIKRIRLADTVGIATPGLCRETLLSFTAAMGDAHLGIHAHNDLGMAVANTIEAVKTGCIYADVTAGGIGERAGNCNMANLVHASSSIFDWGISAADAQKLQDEILEIGVRK